MKWDLGRRGGVEDRRGLSGGAIAGGGGIGVIVIALIGYFLGVDPQQLTQIVNQAQGPAQQQAGVEGTPTDEEGAFADVVHTSANDVWAQIFQQTGRSYRPSTVVLYTEGTSTGCGYGQAAMGPFYCPADERVYLDLNFFQTLDTQMGAGGDFAKAYVIGHEVGHHVQNVLGLSQRVQNAQGRLSEAEGNKLSVKLELQADCYAGIWARQSNDQLNWLESGDLDEALRAASAVGDDTLQKRSTGSVVPDSFTHGSSAERMQWFKTGYNSGNPDACDTFG
ncbi:neutral zinc metallopeptidase [Asticcacaulis sp. ZE23SCel15]|uniref:KPN_02809 family neutral zinc metallopeptidase n=1 Tax=Asticcacaulis sp. ZE23SCel15 TaxID=3059027 RepID=UPI00265EE012|nr:neutral zinc metallopeptidase [Asticcacaulis sp. ZE23SCel15]WKL57200.1 neutral zinc metallopeptidase [Asticcacaulis sp. ZE23SCel15]